MTEWSDPTVALKQNTREKKARVGWGSRQSGGSAAVSGPLGLWADGGLSPKVKCWNHTSPQCGHEEKRGSFRDERSEAYMGHIPCKG